MGQPFLTLQGFIQRWDGPPLTPAQQAQVGDLLQVAADWIYARVPSTIAPDDPRAVRVTYEVVADAIRFGKYSRLASFHNATGHRISAGTLENPVSGLDFTDSHKQLLGIPLRGTPTGTFRCNDFIDSTPSGWPTRWGHQFGPNGYYTYLD